MSDRFDKYRNLKNVPKEEALKRLGEAPDICPLLALKKCESYYFDEGIVYVSNPAYYAYTIPEWNEKDKDFTYYKIDMDNDCEVEKCCIELDEVLESGYSIDDINNIYDINLNLN